MDTKIRGIASVDLREFLLLEYKVNHWPNRNLLLTKVYQELVGVFHFVTYWVPAVPLNLTITKTAPDKIKWSIKKKPWLTNKKFLFSVSISQSLKARWSRFLAHLNDDECFWTLRGKCTKVLPYTHTSPHALLLRVVGYMGNSCVHLISSYKKSGSTEDIWQTERT